MTEQSANGSQAASEEPTNEVLGYLKAIKIVICADGMLSSSEMENLRKGMEQIGLDTDAMREIEEFDVRGVRLEDVLPQDELSEEGARKLLYTTIDTAKADGLYSEEERHAVARVAELLGVETSILHAIEALVDFENAADKLRTALFLEV